MYTELYAAWRRENHAASLGGLPPDFYARIADYLRRIRDENRMLDKKSVKVNLLDREAQNVKRMLEELLWARYKKLVKTITQNQQLPSALLTVEEAKMCESFVTFTGTYQKFAKDLMLGQAAKIDAEVKADAKVDLKVEVGKKRLALRFLKNTPAII